MAERPTCPICGKRRPERFCPAKGEKICAVCCATEREVTLDCPADCSFLVSAHRYEIEHRKPLAESEVPFPDVEFSPNLIYERQPLLADLSFTILQFGMSRRDLADRDILDALIAQAETYRTLISGIYYEKPPQAPLASGLYEALAQSIREYKKKESEGTGFQVVKDAEIFYLLVFLARMGRSWTNGRPRARIFLEYLRTQFPAVRDAQAEASRIIVP